MDDNGTIFDAQANLKSVIAKIIGDEEHDPELLKAAVQALHRQDIRAGVAALERIADALEAQPSLRDQMAMAALAGAMANENLNPQTTYGDAAQDAYDMAGYMLATRQKEGE